MGGSIIFILIKNKTEISEKVESTENFSLSQDYPNPYNLSQRLNTVLPIAVS